MKKKIVLALAMFATTLNVNASDYANFVKEDFIKGDITAPVTMIVYASATCGHCSHFEKDVISKLDETYIKQGKVAYAFREYPLDDLATAVARVQRCAGEKSYYNFVNAYFSSQRTWIMAQDKLQAIKQIAMLGGMTSESVEACIMDKKVERTVDFMKKTGSVLGVRATPTFFINGKKHEGAMSYAEVKGLIDQELAK